LENKRGITRDMRTTNRNELIEEEITYLKEQRSLIANEK